MSKSIYILKMTLLFHQLDIHWQTKKKVEKMAIFIVFVYLKAWFNAPSLTSAATNDLDLYRSLQKFKAVHKKVSQSTSAVLNRHTWYLTEELIPFSLFDEDLSLDARTLLAAEIGQKSSGGTDIRKPTLPSLTATSTLIDFVGDRSTTLFDLLDIPVDFLLKKDWNLQPEYSSIQSSLKSPSPLNDSCERALGLMSTYNAHITRDEESFQELIQVVEKHRKIFSNKKKEALKEFY